MDGKENLIIKLAEEQYAKTKNIAYLGVCLNFSLALRVGELVALRTNDFSDTTVKISRQEIFSTTEKYYEFSTQSLSNRANAFEQALSGTLKAKNVTKCNQSA